MRKRWLVVAVLAVTALVVDAALATAGGAKDTVRLTVFYGEGCPYCAAELAFLDDLGARIPELEVAAYEVWHDEANRLRFARMTAARGVEPHAVPTTIVGRRVWVGFDARIGAELEAAVRDALGRDGPTSSPGPASVDVPLLGTVEVGDRSLVVATLVIGFVDGVNPCSLWVLTILLALVLHGRSRRRVVLVGATFLAVTAAMYGLYMAGFYGAIGLAGSRRWIGPAVALVVGALGALQVASAYEVRGLPRLGISPDRRPGLYRRMRALSEGDRPNAGLLFATAGLAVGVSLLETPCTAGLPMLWTQMVAQHDIAVAGTLLLFGLYLAVFLIDEALVFGVTVATMRAVKLQERHGRALKLVSGVVMLSLAVVLVAAPTTMDSLSGALAVSVVTAAIAAASIGVDRVLRSRGTLTGRAHRVSAHPRHVGGR